MIKSESIKEIAVALSKFQGEITNPLNSAKNPQFNSKYAPLQDILSLTRPILAKNGLSVLQSTTGDLENVTVSTMLLHSSGEFMETEPFVLKGEQTAKGGGKVLNVQGAGSMITYIRRYQISAILGLASEDDDDGNHSTKKTEKAVETEEEKNKRETEEFNKKKIDANKVKTIKSLLEKSKGGKEVFLKYANVKSIEDIVNVNFTSLTGALQRSVDKIENNKNELDGVI